MAKFAILDFQMKPHGAPCNMSALQKRTTCPELRPFKMNTDCYVDILIMTWPKLAIMRMLAYLHIRPSQLALCLANILMARSLMVRAARFQRRQHTAILLSPNQLFAPIWNWLKNTVWTYVRWVLSSRWTVHL